MKERAPQEWVPSNAGSRSEGGERDKEEVTHPMGGLATPRPHKHRICSWLSFKSYFGRRVHFLVMGGGWWLASFHKESLGCCFLFLIPWRQAGWPSGLLSPGLERQSLTLCVGFAHNNPEKLPRSDALWFCLVANPEITPWADAEVKMAIRTAFKHHLNRFRCYHSRDTRVKSIYRGCNVSFCSSWPAEAF